jgi:hypothetical protein
MIWLNVMLKRLHPKNPNDSVGNSPISIQLANVM